MTRSSKIALCMLVAALGAATAGLAAADLDPIIAQLVASGHGDQPVTALVVATQAPLNPIAIVRRMEQEGVHPLNRLSFVRRARAEASLEPVRAAIAELTKDSPGVLDLNEPVWTVNAMAVRAPARTLEQLAQRPSVESVIADRDFSMVDPGHPSPRPEAATGSWGVLRVGADKVWSQFHAMGQGALIGHIDTGVDATHPDLKGKVVQFRDFTKLTAPVMAAYDDEGHGTHTAGTIAGGSNAGGPIGIAPQAHLIVAKALNKEGAGGMIGLIRAMAWIADPDGHPQTHDQPLAVSCSWGASVMIPVVSRMFWLSCTALREAGVIPVFASGNEGPGKLGVPGAYPHCMAVGALDERDAVADFTSRGTVRWGLTLYDKPDISAPGVDILSSIPGGRYELNDGTSMATPHVAGGLALIWSVNPHLSSKQVEKVLLDTAHDLGTPGHDAVFGAGLLDLAAAAARARAMAATPDRTEESELPQELSIAHRAASGSVADLVLPSRP